MTSEIGSQLSGFCPYLPYNNEELKKLLFDNFISAIGKQKTCLTILKRYLNKNTLSIL